MRSVKDIASFLSSYDGPRLRLMEVCGTHTAEISANGIEALLSDRIRLISGPGCPVCVTVTAYIDRLIALSREENTTVLCFGDMMRVPGSAESLAEARASGASADFVYSPMDVVPRAEREPSRRFVFAAVGFETTAPVYAALLDALTEKKIDNVSLLTSLKTMPGAIRRVAALAGKSGGRIDGFLAPGHVCVVAGTDDYDKLAGELGVPFVVSGFKGEELICSIYALVKLSGQAVMRNLYPSAVSREGNRRAREAVDKYFKRADASWRGLGSIEGSGLVLREEYARFDAGSVGLDDDSTPAGCRCGEVLTGTIRPEDCPMYGVRCSPQRPVGACMVSAEGSCFTSFRGGGGKIA